jgi:hypothetical protein
MPFYSHRRSALICLSLVLSALIPLFFFYDLDAIVTLPLPDRDYPPNHKNLRKWIHDLPQHNLNLPFPEGKNGRYVKFSCQVQQLGWNNLLNEVYVTFFPFILFSLSCAIF